MTLSKKESWALVGKYLINPYSGTARDRLGWFSVAAEPPLDVLSSLIEPSARDDIAK